MIDLAPNRSDRYSQTNNKSRPFSACFATTVTQGIDVRKYDLSPLLELAFYVESNQPEDGLGWLLDNDDEVRANWRKWHPYDLEIEPYLWADCMVFAVNKLFNYNTAAFVPDLTFNKCVSYVERNIPVCFSGRYEGIAGHYVIVVGWDELKKELIIDDPYGNTLAYGNRANGTDGYHVRYSKADYDRVSKNYGVRIE